MHIRTRLLLPVVLTAALAACQPSQPQAAAAAAPAAEPAAAEAVPEAVEGVSGTYVIDPAHTTVIAQWNHFGFSNPVANFGDVEDVTASSLEVTLPLSGLNSFVADFDTHLRSADFFDAERFPVATFRSTSVQQAGPGKLTVTGDLTIKDNTHPVVLDVTMNRF